MNTECGKPWSRKFIMDNFTLKFATQKLRAHQEKVLFDQEKALMPETQHIVEERIRVEKFRQEEQIIYEQIRQLNRQKQELWRRFHAGPSREEARQVRQFVRACPAENCRGFLSTQWKCGICEQWSCPDCHVIKGAERDTEHTCNPDDVATARLLAADTKPCPKCGEGIFKIDGCDQMWCTQCQTAFSWRTGRIETHIHNPHYYEWLRKRGDHETLEQLNRAQNNVCQEHDRIVTHRTMTRIHRRLAELYTINDARRRHITAEVGNAVESIVHLSQNVLQTLRDEPQQEANVELRVAYMRNIIGEEIFKTHLQRNHKKREKKQELREIVEMFVRAASDIIFRYKAAIDICETQEQVEQITILKDEIPPLVQYVNECLEMISRTFKCVQQCIVMRSEIDRTYNPVLCSMAKKDT